MWVLHNWETENYYWEPIWRRNFGQSNHWAVGVASIGVEHHTLGATVLGVCGCGTSELPNESVIWDTHGEQIPETNRH